MTGLMAPEEARKYASSKSSIPPLGVGISKGL
jgi:hypothetical protein